MTAPGITVDRQAASDLRVIVTRPASQATIWIQALRDQGLEAVSLPMIVIAPVPDPGPARAAWQGLSNFAAVMFVSANAVEHFLRYRPAAGGAQPDAADALPRAWATGPGTVGALPQAGWPVDRIDAPPSDSACFDSEALWERVGAGVAVGQRVLIVRGGDESGAVTGRDWLWNELNKAGVLVEQVPVYVRRAPTLQAEEIARARHWAGDGSIWLFSSSEALANLEGALPEQDWRGARALATHPRIAQALHHAGFGVVCTSRPSMSDVAASIKSLG